jgi:hypothetical protein
MAMLSLRTAAREMGGPPSATSRGIAGGGSLWYLQVALPVCENYGALSLRNWPNRGWRIVLTHPFSVLVTSY